MSSPRLPDSDSSSTSRSLPAGVTTDIQGIGCSGRPELKRTDRNAPRNQSNAPEDAGDAWNTIYPVAQTPIRVSSSVPPQASEVEAETAGEFRPSGSGAKPGPVDVSPGGPTEEGSRCTTRRLYAAGRRL